MTDNRPVADRFATLDEYLEFLRARAGIGMHWYREVAPGLYQLETTNRHGEPPRQRRFTRAELMRRFGFSR